MTALSDLSYEATPQEDGTYTVRNTLNGDSFYGLSKEDAEKHTDKVNTLEDIE